VDALQEIASDDDIRVVVLTGAGRGFCAGADLSGGLDPMLMRDGSPLNPGQSWHLHFERLDKPIIGAINGVAAGGGLAVALGADIRIASERATFSSIFIKNQGIPVGDAVSALLPRLVGPSHACRIILTGDLIPAQEALQMGLVNQVVPPDDLMKATMELAQRMAANPPVALRFAKRAVYHALYTDPATHLAYEEYASMMARSLESPEEMKRRQEALARFRQ
jgi:enoyl-CoA hydratase/carnithine racemase